jgi:hypothetical protein
MKQSLRCLLLLVLVLAAPVSRAAELSPLAVAEIGRLLELLGGSDCRFNRNGSWYPAAEARGHLQKKLDYLRGKGMLASVDDFNDKAGTGSSMSGKPYQVQCGTQPAQASADWLRGQLLRLRAAPAAGKGPSTPPPN